jgi:hypothetical protein
MLPIRNRWIDRIDGWVCRHRPACDARAATVGKWTGARVLRCRERDGTEWTIYRAASGHWCLRMKYREHSMLTTGLLSIEAAQAHAADMAASLAARSLRDYAEGVR